MDKEKLVTTQPVGIFDDTSLSSYKNGWSLHGTASFGSGTLVIA
jgi:hypothetical protein